MQESERGKFEAEWKKAFDKAELTPSESVWQGIGLRLGQGSQNLSASEKGWKNAFSGAELSPSEEVWKAIDVSLVQAENATMKRRVVYYQRLAAASVIILMLMSGYFLFNGNESSPDTSLADINSNKGNQNSESILPVAADSSEKIELSVSKNDNQFADNKKGAVNENGNSFQTAQSDKQTHYPNKIAPHYTEEKAVSNLVANNSYIDSTISRNAFAWDSPVSEIQLLAMNEMPDFFGPNDFSIAYRLADVRPAVRVSKRTPVQSENKWASVAFSAGTFSPSVGGGELTQASSRAIQSNSFANLSADQPVRDEKVSIGTSMAFAVAAGKRVFKKWLIQGGVSYLNQTANSSADVVTVAPANQLEDAKFSMAYKPETTNSVTYTTPGEINSNFQFISIPVQAGYMVVDRKFGVQINGGVSPDFFLKSSVYDQSTQTETTGSASGANESFKVVSLAGIGGIELSYKFSRHYRISLAPGFRYALTPVYKENSLATAKPFVADIGLRFRYVFN